MQYIMYFLLYSFSTHLLCYLLILPKSQLRVWFSNNLLAHTCGTNKLTGVRASTGACWSPQNHYLTSAGNLPYRSLCAPMLPAVMSSRTSGHSCELRTTEILSGSKDINLLQSYTVSRSLNLSISKWSPNMITRMLYECHVCG